jgi:predicted amidohydrolase
MAMDGRKDTCIGGNGMNFNVALLQILPAGSQEANLIKGLAYCQKAKQMGADLALFPEMWNIGYALTPDREKTEKNAVGLDSEFITQFRELAKAQNMAIGITFLEKHSPSPRNSLAVIDRYGEIVLSYSKLHTCVFDLEERWLTAGDDFYVADLETESGTVKIGAMICYDREQPESARILMLKGAEIILVPNACPMEINRLTQLRARAYENMVGIVTVNYPHGQPDCNGHSTAFDGIAYKSENSSSSDMLIVDAGETEGIYIARFPIDELRDYRKREIHGNAYRRPEKYHLLINKDKSEPFIRKNMAGDL